MPDVHGSVRVVIASDGEVLLDETHPSQFRHVEKVGKALRVDGHPITVTFEFDPPVSFTGPESIASPRAEENT